jgi:hypothetical protein
LALSPSRWQFGVPVVSKGPQGQKRPGPLWQILLVVAFLLATLAADMLISGKIPNGFVITVIFAIGLIALIWRRHAKAA